MKKITLSKLIESLFVSEGKHWPEDYKKTAINNIKNSQLGKADWYSDDLIEQDVDTFVNEFGPLSHKNSNLGYFSTIIKWFIEYTGVDKNKYQEFIERKLDGIIRDLLWLSNSPEEEEKVKEQLKTKWLFDDFEKYQNEVVDKKRNVDIDIQQDHTAEYDLIPIEAYKELNSTFGGEWTGYKGKSEWCHTNGESTYKSWTNKGTNKFYILARKDWKSIKPSNPKTTDAYDQYGTSLIALLVGITDIKLKCATLRWNHIIEPSETISGTSVDHAFSSFEQLSKISGLDIKSLVEADLKNEIEKKKEKERLKRQRIAKTKQTVKEKIENFKNLSEISENYFTTTERKYITNLEIPDNIVSIANNAFMGCIDLTTVTFGNGLKEIGEHTFHYCKKLKSVTFKNGLQKIGEYAFYGTGIEGIIEIPESVKSIGESAFEYCQNITDIILNAQVKKLYGTFSYCIKLKNIKLPDTLKIIDKFTFYGCFDLETIKIPSSITKIEKSAFYNTGLKTIIFKDKTKEEVNKIYSLKDLPPIHPTFKIEYNNKLYEINVDEAMKISYSDLKKLLFN